MQIHVRHYSQEDPYITGKEEEEEACSFLLLLLFSGTNSLQVLQKTWNGSHNNDTISGIEYRDTIAIPEALVFRPVGVGRGFSGAPWHLGAPPSLKKYIFTRPICLTVEMIISELS